MAKPEKRWQLLLVADDGRIIPFKRVKGMVLALMLLLVLLGLICAGLVWQLTAEKVRYRRTVDQLADADRQMAHYKSQHELIAAELVLAEARMEKAGLLIPRRSERNPQQSPLKTMDADAAINVKKEAREETPDPSSTAGSATAEAAPEKTDAAPVPVQAPAPTEKPVDVSPEPGKPAVVVSDWKIKHDATSKTLLARFRVKNTGPRSSPVAGRCVVVLKHDGLDSAAWVVMPEGKLVAGKPDGKEGQAFKISRYRDMEIEAAGQTDPSSFKTATVYVFDLSGVLVSAKEYPLDLPAPKPEPEVVPASQPAAAPASTDTVTVPLQPPAGKLPVNQPVSGEASGAAPATPPVVPPPDAGAGAALQPLSGSTPADDPSPTDSAEPVKQEDARSRF